MTYRSIIEDVAKRHLVNPINPVGVEASMRLQFGTLDHLPREMFVIQTVLAAMCEDERPGYLRSVADSYGMAAEFDILQKFLELSRNRPLGCGSPPGCRLGPEDGRHNGE